MKMIFTTILIIVICFFAGKDSEPIKIINLLSKFQSNIRNLSDIAVDIQYIPLQISKSSLIGWIKKIKTTEKYIYVCTTNEILCFDKTGKYQLKISKAGSGPGEYSHLNDFDVTNDDSYIIINSFKSFLLYKRNNNSFSFIKKSAPYCHKMEFTSENNILLSYDTFEGTEPFRYILINTEGDTLGAKPNTSGLMPTDRKIGIGFENVSYHFDNRIKLKHLYSDTVYCLDRTNKFSSCLVFNSGGKIPSPKDRINSQYFNNHISEFIIFSNIIETSRYLIYTFYENKKYCFIYDKTSGVQNIIDTKKWLADDLAGGSVFEPKTCYKKTLISWVNVIDLKNQISSEEFRNLKVKYPEKKKDLEKLANSLNENDNPVLILVKLKD